jgi:hypothetical protein
MKPFDHEEFGLMTELRALELAEVWRHVWTGKFDGYLKTLVRVSPGRYRRWVAAHAGNPLVSTAIMDHVAKLRKNIEG